MELPDVKERWTSTINTVTIGATKEEGGTRTSTVTVAGTPKRNVNPTCSSFDGLNRSTETRAASISPTGREAGCVPAGLVVVDRAETAARTRTAPAVNGCFI